MYYQINIYIKYIIKNTLNYITLSLSMSIMQYHQLVNRPNIHFINDGHSPCYISESYSQNNPARGRPGQETML